jgi:ribonuclease HII
MIQKIIIAGIDEAGRGALAGPVVAAAVILPTGEVIPKFIQDSKVLTAQKRELAYEWIIKEGDYGIGIVPAEKIDEIGIKPANHQAMTQAVEKLKIKPGKLLVDGCDRFQFKIESEDIIHGDQLHPVISAASILAKVTRDRLMVDYDKQYLVYGFAGHKGYGSAQHLKILESRGPCPIHRRSYQPLQTWLTQSRLDLFPAE